MKSYSVELLYTGAISGVIGLKAATPEEAAKAALAARATARWPLHESGEPMTPAPDADVTVLSIHDAETGEDVYPEPAAGSGDAPSLADVLREALAYEAAQFDGPEDEDLHVGGADTVDWFSQWRLRAKAAMTAHQARNSPDLLAALAEASPAPAKVWAVVDLVYGSEGAPGVALFTTKEAAEAEEARLIGDDPQDGTYLVVSPQEYEVQGAHSTSPDYTDARRNHLAPHIEGETNVQPVDYVDVDISSWWALGDDRGIVAYFFNEDLACAVQAAHDPSRASP